MVIVEDNEVERILPVVRMNCALSGGCVVYKNGKVLSCVMGDEELCWVSQDEGRDPNVVRQKLTEALR